MRNKGGMVCKMTIAGTTFAVIACHLSASRDISGITARNNDLLRILTSKNIPVRNNILA